MSQTEQSRGHCALTVDRVLSSFSVPRSLARSLVPFVYTGCQEFRIERETLVSMRIEGGRFVRSLSRHAGNGYCTCEISCLSCANSFVLLIAVIMSNYSVCDK